MTVRCVSMISFALACALGATACGNSQSAAKAAAFMPTQQFNGKITDFECFPSECDHAHYTIGDAIVVKPKGNGEYHFKSTKKDGEVNESELTYKSGILRGTTKFDHHGAKMEHWLILIPYENEQWKIVTCRENPGTAESCDGDQHAGYGHADD